MIQLGVCLGISDLSGRIIFLPWYSSGTRQKVPTLMDMWSAERIRAKNLRKSCGLIWARLCGGRIVPSFIIMSSTSIKIFLNPFRVGIIQYTQNVCEMHDLAKFMPQTLKNGDEYDMADWTVYDKLLSDYYICIAIKDRIPTSMRYDMQDKGKDYISFPH